MRTRTLLTTPVGSEPDVPGHRADVEVYSGAIALPHELGVPGRFRRVWVTVLVLVVLLSIAAVMWKSSTSGQEFDPTLDVPLDSVEDGANLPGES